MKIVLILFLLSAQIFAQQSVDSIIESKTKELNSYGVKDFFYFESYCIGGFKIVDGTKIDCSLNNSNLYVFWKKDNKNFVEKIDKCVNPKIEIEDKIFNFYLKNINQIKDESVEKYTIREDSIVGNMKYSRVKMVSHSCHSKFHFYVNATLIEKRFDKFNLTTEEVDPNLNYNRNNNLKLVELGKLCDEVIKLKNIK